MRAVDSGWLTVALLTLLLGVSLAGGLLPRGDVSAMAAPALSAADAEGAAADVSPRDVGIALDAARSRPLRALLAFVGAVSLLRLLWLWLPAWTPPPRQVAMASPDEGIVLALDVAPADAWSLVRRALAVAGRQLTPLRPGDGVELAVVHRGGAARWLPGLFYLGVLLLLLAGEVGQRFGYASAPLELTLGETRSLSGGDALSLHLEQLAVLPGPQGQPSEVRSEVSVQRDGEGTRSVALGPLQSARAFGYRFYQLDVGPAARVSARSGEGSRLRIHHLVGAVPPAESFRVAFAQRQGEELLAIPEADLVVRLVYYASLPTQGLGETIHVQALQGRSRALLAETFVTGQGQLYAGEVLITVVPEFWVAVQAQREPDVPLAAAGATSLFLGLLGLVLWPPSRGWVAVQEIEDDGAVCQLVVRRGEVDSAWVASAAALLREDAVRGQ